MLDKIKDFFFSVSKIDALQEKIDLLEEANLKMRQEVDTSFEKQREAEKEASFQIDINAKQKLEIELWKMRADERTHQYEYWLSVAKEKHALTLEEVLQHSKKEMQKRKEDADN